MLSTLSLRVTVTDSRLASNAVVSSLFDGASTHRTIYPLLDARSDPPYTYDSAIRVSELRGLTTESLKLNETIPYIRVHGKGDKERIVSITDKTAEHLKRYLCRFHSEMDSKCPLFYTVIKGNLSAMSTGNVERILNKYAEMIRPEHPDLPQKLYPHMLRRTRACGLYQSGVELELVSRILGHTSTQTTRIYASPSIEMLKTAMENSSVDMSEACLLYTSDAADE